MNNCKRIIRVLSVLALAPAYAGAQYFAYVANNGDNTVSGYSINPTTGALTAIPGSPFPSGSGPNSVAVSPTGQFDGERERRHGLGV